MGAEETEFTPLETRRRANKVVGPTADAETEESFAMNGVVESRMMSVAAKRIVQLEQALEESEQVNLTTTKFYKDKIAKLHRQQMYSVDRMGQRIDVLEEELMSRTTELHRAQQELRKAVEKVVTLQQEIAQCRPSSNSTDSTHQHESTIGGLVMMMVQKQEQQKPTTMTTKRPPSTEERSYPSSAGSEGQFEGAMGHTTTAAKMVFHPPHKSSNKKNKKSNNKKKRCKVESNWDDAVIVPDSFMTAVDDSSSSPDPAVVMESDHVKQQKDANTTAAAGISRFFPFGQRHKETADVVGVATRPSEFTIRPNVIEDFYESCSNGSVPDTIMIGSGR